MARIFGTWAALIIFMVFFCVPFSMRGARLAIQDIRNDVKDWLPADFPETRDLSWFGKHFLSEKFVVLTFDGCNAKDERFKLFSRKLQAEVVKPGTNELENKKLSKAQKERIRARIRGSELGLFHSGKDDNYAKDWGGLSEKWLQGDNDSWYYILPNGELYRWLGGSHVVGAIGRAIERTAKGKVVHGEKVDHFGATTTPKGKPNEFYQDPRRLTARYLSSIMTGPQVLELLSKEDGPLWPRGQNLDDQAKAAKAKRDAINRLLGNLYQIKEGQKIPEDAEILQTCLVVTLSKHGEAHFDRVVGRGLLGKPLGKLQQLARESGINLAPDPPMLPFAEPAEGTEPMLRMGGPPVDNVAIDEEGTITLVRLIGFSLALGVILSYLCFRRVVVTIMVFVVGGVSAVTSMALVFYTNGSVDAVLLTMPSLVYVLGLSGAVHIVNYYRDAVQERGEEGAAERAIAHGWMPCTLAAITTAIGLLSLRTSNIVPISKFGTYSAIGVVATLVLLFTYLPAALEIWRPARSRREEESASTPSDPFLVTYFWEPIGRWIVNHYVVVGTACLAVMIACAMGLPNVKTSVQLLKLFDGKARIIQDYRWMEGNLGKLVPMELVVRVKPEMIGPTMQEREEGKTKKAKPGVYPLSLLERAELVHRIQQAVEREFGDQGRGIVGKGTSTVTFLPELPNPGSTTRQRSARGVVNTNMERKYAELQEMDFLSRDTEADFEGSELWRISLRLAALSDVDYGVFVNDLKQVIEPVLEAYRCRTELYSQLEVKFNGNYQGKRVFVVGAENPIKKKARTKASKKGTKKGEPKKDQPNKLTPTEQRQTEFFTSALDALLKNKGFDGFRKPQWVSHRFLESRGVAGIKRFTQFRGKRKRRKPIEIGCFVIATDIPEKTLNELKAAFPEETCLYLDYRKHRATDKTPTTPRSESIHVVYTGVVPVVYKAQRTLLVSLIDSIGMAFVLIGMVMVVLLNPGRSAADGLRPINVTKGFLSGAVAMIPNLYPVVMIFGIMCHMGMAIDIGSMMTASVAMGVAVDDTIHFLSWFRRSVQQGMTRQAAIIETYRRVGPAMTQTTLIGGLGLFVFGLSTFTPTQRFGILMLTLLLAALLGDLIFLPALLASPLGKLFMPSKEKSVGPSGDSSSEQPGESGPNPPHTRQASNRRRIGGRQIRRDAGHG